MLQHSTAQHSIVNGLTCLPHLNYESYLNRFNKIDSLVIATGTSCDSICIAQKRVSLFLCSNSSP